MFKSLYTGVIRKMITSDKEQQSYSGGFWPRLVREAATEETRSLSGRILELGCGEGLFLGSAARANPGLEVIGLESEERMLTAARSRLAGIPHITVIGGNALATGLENASLDACFCLNMLHNLPSVSEVKAVLMEAHRLTRPGGRFVFDIRNALNPLIRLQYGLAPLYDPDIRWALRTYRFSAIEKISADIGFRRHSLRFLGFPANRFAPVALFVLERI